MLRVLILGATSAIAAEIALRYAQRGATLYLVGRSAEKLTDVCARLGDAVLGWELADLDETARNAAVVERAITTLGGLDIAVIAHGLLGDQRASEHDWAAADQILRTNLASPVSLLLPIADHCERVGAGHIAVLSSVAGDRGRPRNFTYGAAKAGLTVYLQGLRSRLWSAGVGVHTFKLGPVDTPMTVDHPKSILFARADAVAETIVEGIDRGVAEAYVPKFWRPILGVVRRLPESWFQRVGALAGR
ncbi:MAG: SDR family NAD(P)-dependent oxidoreductase [Deltaproteobacteria bacterium]|nr:SDR family NAD(P)-dependent oxidoreductase [Nannocystaceae bacterium]